MREFGVYSKEAIVKNTNLHGIGTGNRDNCELMMDFIDRHRIRPQIDTRYGFDRADEALGNVARGAHFGKLVIDFL